MFPNEGSIYLLLGVLLLTVHGAHEPPPGIPAFVRSAVESQPENEDSSTLAKFSLRPTFGDIFLPLRSAVESAPSVSLRFFFEPEKTFIRSAVEARPSNEDINENYEIDPMVMEESHPFVVYAEEPNAEVEKYAAYIVPNSYDVHYPQPYRLGSPYQTLVDINDVSPSEINQGYAAEPRGLMKLRKQISEKPKVLCYMTNWAWYRKNDGKFAPEHLDTKLCSVVIYSFAALDPETLMIREFDPWIDIENDLYQRTTALDVPVLIALGGWTDSSGDKYSVLASSPQKRKTFAANLVNFLTRYGFKGLHLDWNYPKCWQSDCKKGPASDKPNFTKLIQEIRSEFDKVNSDLQLGIAISGYKEVITEAYELPALSNLVNYLTVMSYDYHGAWERHTGHVSPLYGRSGDKYPQYNTDFTIQLLIRNGAAREKIIMGIPFYGQSFTLADAYSQIVGEGTPAIGPGEAGELTRQPGMMAYYEICQRVRKNKWQVGRDPGRKAGPYAMLRNQWVGYEDAASVEAKARYALNNGLGGVAAWTVDLDDFLNRCCSETYPLLKAINRALGLLSTPPPVGVNCGRPVEPVTPVAPVMTTVGESGLPHEHTTWPSWNPSSSSKKPETTTWPNWTPPKKTSTMTPTMTTKKTTTMAPATTTKKTTTMASTMPTRKTTAPWWSTSSTEPSTWWPTKPSTTSTPSTTLTTRRTTTTTRWTTQPTKPTTSTKRPESTTIPSPAVIMPVFSTEDTKCTPGLFKPDPTNCNAYYQCVLGEMKQQFCAGGLHWNAEGQRCDWPDNAKCEEQIMDEAIASTTKKPPTRWTTRTTPTTMKTSTKMSTWWNPTTSTHRTTAITRWTTTTRKVTTTKNTNKPAAIVSTSSSVLETGCVSGQYYAHEECDSFYICVNGKPITQQCGPGLQWNVHLNQCDWESEVQCLSVKMYLRLIMDGRSSISDPCDGNEYIPYPGDCSLFLRCVFNRLEIGYCPPGLHWNPTINSCDWPHNARCRESDEVVQPISPPGDNTIAGGEGSPVKPPCAGGSQTTSRPTHLPRPTISTTTTHRPITTTSPRPTYPTDRPVLEPLSGYYKVVCYFTNWAWYRKGLGKYTPDNINTDLCTHIVYGFAVLDYSELTIRTHDSWADIDNKFYQRVADLRSKGVKVSLALGGWNDSQGDKYSRLVRNAAARAKFVKQAVQFIEKYGFEGLDLDWEYPVCWQTDCNKGYPDEKEGFTELVRALYEEFQPRGYLLSTAVSPSKKIIDAGYDVPALSRYFDWIAVMTYDFHGQWDKKTGHVAPLYYHPEDDIDYFNANFSIHYWMEKGAPSRKIVMGMPLYGQSFTLADVKENGLNAKAPGAGQAGEFTRAAGFLAYYEICDRVKTKGWTVVKDPLKRMGPYAYKDRQWVSFDDSEMLQIKSRLIRDLDLGGGMIWALDLDDFKNRCGEGVHPLLTTIRNVLKEAPKPFETQPDIQPVVPTEENDEVVVSAIDDTHESYDQQEDNGYNTDGEAEVIPPGPDDTAEQNMDESPPYDPNMEVESASSQSENLQMTDEFKVVCYFTNWAWYRQGGGKYLPEDIDPDLCTHIVYGFAVLNRDSLTIKPHDSWADLDNKFYERVVSFKSKGKKVTVAIGGWNDSAGDKYSRLVRNAQARARFIKHVIEFIERYGFDGLDLDWEYPVCWQVDCGKGFPDEKEAFAALVKELSDEFKPRGLLLSSAVSPNKKVIDAGYDIPTLTKYFDWIAVMAYDYHGQWDKKTGHVAPMYDHPGGTPTFNANFSINYWIDNGADRKKIVMGMPMYGQSFSLADNNRYGLNSPTYGGGEAGEATRARGFLSYYEICRNIRDRGWKVVRDRRGRMGPYAYSRGQWVSFDDAFMIRHKSEYVKAMDLGGAMIWALDLDDFRNVCDCEQYPLLKTINRVLRNYPGPHAKCKLEEKAEIAPEDDGVSAATTPAGPTTWWPTTPSSSTWWTQTSTTVRPTYRPTTERPTRPTTPARPTWEGIDEDKEVKCDGSKFLPHKKDCSKYYICQYGVPLEQSCPDGLYWNENHCDWPHMSNCVSSQSDSPLPKPTTQKPMGEKPTKKPVEATTKRPTDRPKPSPPKPPTFEGNGEYKVVCYFTNWAWYRPGDGKYTPDDIDYSLCTHIVYGFAVLDRDTLTIKPHDSWADIDNRFYERVVALQNKGIRVTLAIGGWNDSAGDKYSRLVRNPQARSRFVKTVIEFLEKYKFEGLDLDWEYPVCWQVDCKKGFPDEKQGFADLVRELSAEFKPKGLLLSSAVSPSKMVIDAGYDVPTLSRYFDWIAVMTYDYHGHWDKQTGHVAPLYYVEGDTYDYFNANFTIRYWIEKGASPRKLVMGMPLYGQSFSLADPSQHGLNAKAYGAGEAGEYTRAGGFLSYYEICERVNRGGWSVVHDKQGRIGPYAYKGNQWVSYDDVEQIRRKARFLKSLGLGGGMIWALDLDDFRGRCGCGKHPLLRTLTQELRGIPGQRASDCT